MVTRKLTTAVLVALALGLAGSLVWGLWHRGQAQVLAVENERLQADLEAVRGVVALYSAVTIAQADQRAQSAKAVRAVRDTIRKEDRDAQEPRPVASDRQLERLRRLADAGNAGIHSASKLP